MLSATTWCPNPPPPPCSCSPGQACFCAGGSGGLISANDKYLDLATQASLTSWNPTVSPDGTLGQALLPSLIHERIVTRAICARALLRAGNNDFDGFCSDVMTIKRLTRLIGGWTLIERLVATAMNQQADQTIAVVVAGGALTAPQCAQLAKSLDSLEPLPDARDVLDFGERCSTAEFVCRIALNEVKLSGLGSPDLDARFARLSRADLDWDTVLKHVGRRFDQSLAMLNDTSLVTIGDLEAADKKFQADMTTSAGPAGSMANLPDESKTDYSDRLADRLALITGPSFTRSTITIRRARMLDSILRTLVAAGQYCADRAHWPATLGDLVPAYVPAVPKDIFAPRADESVRYLQTDTGICIYSVGPNHTDDGGLSDAKQKQDDIGLGITPTPAEQGL
jgi:hypothetical protein